MKDNLSSKIKKNIRFLIGLNLLGIFIASFVLEHIFKLEPCELCKIERWVYLPLGFSMFLWGVWKKVWIASFSMAVFGFGISVYHKLMHGGVVESCVKGLYKTYTSFREGLATTKPCTIPSTIFGLELVWVNIIIFLSVILWILTTNFISSKSK